ncbi:MAG: UDP-3-O-(3-hydroxymyristoyl)glucosamine N-acyltransferase [Caulobacteraceae bacterium]
MPDPRFYETLSPTSVGELASLTGARLAHLRHSRHSIDGVANLADAVAGKVCFFSDRRHLASLGATAATACFVAEADAERLPEGCAALITASPHVAYAEAADRLHAARRHEGEGAIHDAAELEEGVTIGPGVVVGAGARIGRGSHISAGAAVGPGVTLGRDCYVGANAVIGFALIGDRVRIHAGAVIGEAGFGAATGRKGIIDIPQLGRVIIQDAVTIGAGTCVDRGALDDTVIGENTKIDNLVQIAHNVTIGRNCLLVAHTGISGSVVIGDNCVFGGRAGIVDHIRIGQGARIAAGAGISKDVPAGETWAGYPARPLVRWKREMAWLSLEAARRPRRGRR